jgi:hypothetical protein
MMTVAQLLPRPVKTQACLLLTAAARASTRAKAVVTMTASADERWQSVAIPEDFFSERGNTDLVQRRGENPTPFKLRVRVSALISFT